MKINTLLASGLLFVAWQMLTGAKIDPNNPPTGKTGAPGETTCQQSGCHGGGSFAGTVTITGVPDTVLPNTTYPITLKNTSNATRAGFELTCLDNANAKCGTLTSAAGVSIGTGAASKQYARQSAPKTLSGGAASWTFNWKSPAAASGNVAKFYFVSLCANGNGGTSGDNVLTGTKQVVLATPSGTEETKLAESIKVFPVPAKDVMNIQLPDQKIGALSLFDMAGHQVLSAQLETANTLNISQLPAGRYLARIQVGKTFATKAIIVQ
jgi:hypothetical protein